MVVDKLNEQIDTEFSNIRTYEKQLKQVKYSVKIEKGLDVREVNNPHTKTL
jgi:hypothetical protein